MNEKNFTTLIASSSKDVISFYDRYAASWDHRFGDKPSTKEFHLTRLKNFLKIANLKKTDRIIEIGVGTGPYLDAIAPLVKEVICIDGSKKMLEILLQNQRHLENIKVLQMDLEKPQESLPIKADTVYAFGLIEHIININSFMQNIKKMLKKRGHLIFVTPNGRCPWYKGIRALWRSGQHCSTDTYYTKEDLDRLLRKHGFLPEVAVYWGYFPAGIASSLMQILKIAGKIIEKVGLQRYAGGLTVSYVFQ